MHNKSLLAALFFALILASCRPEEEGFSNYDWCYTFDFRQSAMGINIVEGILQEGTGLYSEFPPGLSPVDGGNSYIIFNYTHTNLVNAGRIRVKVSRAGSGDISVNGVGDAFGIPVSIAETLPSVTEGGLVVLQRTNIANVTGIMNVTIETSVPIIIEYIELAGYGASPFDTNPCDKVTRTFTPPPITPTSFPPPPTNVYTQTPDTTMTPSATATVTGTSTQTPTPGPTSTPLPAWCSSFDWQYEWDFTVSDGGFARYQNFGQSPSGVWVSGTGWTFGGAGGSNTLISVRRTGMSFVAKEIEVTVSDNTATRGSVNDSIGAAVASGGTSPPHSSTQLAWGNNADFNETNRVRTATNTANSTSSNTIYIYSSSSPNALNAVSRIRVRGNGASPTMAGGTLTLCNPPTTATATVTATPTSTQTPTSTSTNTPIPTFTRTPLPAPSTATATRTPIPFATSTPRPTATRTPIPMVTNTPSGGSSPTPAPTLDVTPTFITATPGGPTLTPGASITPIVGTTTPVYTPGFPPETGIGDGIGSGISGIGDITGVITGFSDLIGDWLGNAYGLGSGVIGDFVNAAPSPIPGLPQCATNPTAHDLCAIYYILKWTLFAPGTPGALIIPLGVIVFNLGAVFIFIRYLLFLANYGIKAIP